MPSLLLFAVVALAMLGSIWLIYSTLQAERDERAQVQRTDNIMQALGDLGRSVINAETGQRGYIITNDRAYLAPYELGRETYPAALARLKQLFSTGPPNAEQDRLMREIEQLADAKFAEMAKGVQFVDEHRIIDANQLILTDRGQELMDRLRNAMVRLEALERDTLGYAQARSTALELRIMPLLAMLAVIISLSLALGLLQISRTARAEAAAAHAEALREARDRADLLARELNHRVKNLFAVILAIVRMTGKGDPAAKGVVDRISQRIHALVNAHEVTQGAVESPTVDLRNLIETAIAPYRSESETCVIEGEAIALPSRLAVPLGLVIHELVTNAVKYGAWAGPGGQVSVAWRTTPDSVHLTWRETGRTLEATERGTGFGSMLIDGSARQIRGSITREFHDEGIEVIFDFPVGD
ncbi:sensor histidine kinase [Novosphingobium tardum]|uniref:histidine kinase n=1 Tax=Novosphingobium tardum TaxID=1538021 RepID=A0ABV8RN59_9SPHN